MRHFAYMLLSALLIGAWSCSDRLNDPVVIAKLENEFVLELREILKGTDRELEVRLRTIEDLDCSNYQLLTRSGRTGNQLFLEVEELRKPGDCQPGARPAESRANFGALSPGFFRLDVELLGIVNNELQLAVSPEQYSLQGSDLNGLVVDEPKLNRIPPDLLWGYLAYPETLSVAPDSTFFQGILSVVAPADKLEPGNYGYFQLEADGRQVRLKEGPAEDLRILPFVYIRKVPAEEVRKTFEQLRPSLGEEVQFRVWTGEGAVW